jgi:hypothetical protein
MVYTKKIIGINNFCLENCLSIGRPEFDENIQHVFGNSQVAGGNISARNIPQNVPTQNVHTVHRVSYHFSREP